MAKYHSDADAQGGSEEVMRQRPPWVTARTIARLIFTLKHWLPSIACPCFKRMCDYFLSPAEALQRSQQRRRPHA